jgi:hypothetical protein
VPASVPEARVSVPIRASPRIRELEVIAYVRVGSVAPKTFVFASAVIVIARGFTLKFCETWLAADVFESPAWFALIIQVPTPNNVMVAPLLPDVVQIVGEPEVNTTVSDAEEEAETVKVSLE